MIDLVICYGLIGAEKKKEYIETRLETNDMPTFVVSYNEQCFRLKGGWEHLIDRDKDIIMESIYNMMWEFDTAYQGKWKRFILDGFMSDWMMLERFLKLVDHTEFLYFHTSTVALKHYNRTFIRRGQPYIPIPMIQQENANAIRFVKHSKTEALMNAWNTEFSIIRPAELEKKANTENSVT